MGLQLEMHLGGKEQWRRRGALNFSDSKNMVVFCTENDVTDLSIYEVGVACRLKGVFFFFCLRRPLKRQISEGKVKLLC